MDSMHARRHWPRLGRCQRNNTGANSWAGPMLAIGSCALQGEKARDYAAALAAYRPAYRVVKCVHTDSQKRMRELEVVIMETTKVGIREFRADLAEYIASSKPVAVTRHGQTVGYFIPTHGQVDADVAALRKASKVLDQLLAEHAVDIEAAVADFKAARKVPGSGKKSGARKA
jgi:hypothetical protein